MGLFSSISASGVLGGIGGGIAGLVGGMYAANKSASSAKRINQANINFEKWKMENAHQIEKKDLDAAGINYKNYLGDGASGSISQVMPDFSGIQAGATSFGQGLQNAAQYALESKNLNIQKQNADTNQIVGAANAAKTLAESKVLEKYGGKEAQARVDQILKNIQNISQQIAINRPKEQAANTATTIFDKATETAANIADSVVTAKMSIKNIAKAFGLSHSQAGVIYYKMKKNEQKYR